MLDKGPFGEQVQFYPYHHLTNSMLNSGASNLNPNNGILSGLSGSDIGHNAQNLLPHSQHQQSLISQAPTFSTATSTMTTTNTVNGHSLQLPSAFAAFHHSQSAAQQRSSHDTGYSWRDPPSSFHHPLSHG